MRRVTGGAGGAVAGPPVIAAPSLGILADLATRVPDDRWSPDTFRRRLGPPPAAGAARAEPAKRRGGPDGRAPRRPPSIKIFKENDRHTRRAIRKEYTLYCDGIPSSAGAGGAALLLEAAEGGAPRLRLAVDRVAEAQTCSVLRDRSPFRAAAGVAVLHLALAEERVPRKATVYKVNPPIRHEAHRLALWRALRRGDVGYVTSGHDPCHPRSKTLESGDFVRAAPGTLAGANELALPALWRAAKAEGFGLERVAAWFAAAPADLLALSCVKAERSLDASEISSNSSISLKSNSFAAILGPLVLEPEFSTTGERAP